jgi:hypothetical protein
MAKVIYEIEMNAANAPMIDQVNRLLLGEGYTEETAAKTPSNEGADKPAAKTESKAESKAEEPATKGDTDTMSLSAFKTAVKKAKADHGEDFAKATLVDGGADKDQPLGRMVSGIDADDYADLVATFTAGPAEQAEEAEEDGLDDEEEEDSSEVTADAVKVAAKAYAKEVGRDEAKEIMNDNGAATLTKIADCSAKQLQAMFKAFTA